MLTLYQEAAMTCPGLSWTVLAAIGTVESGNGTSDLPGVHSGANYAGAEGPMQFEPATFAAYGTPVPPGGAVPLGADGRVQIATGDHVTPALVVRNKVAGSGP